MMVAAIAMALMKAWAQRLVAICRQSLSLPTMRAREWILKVINHRIAP